MVWCTPQGSLGLPKFTWHALRHLHATRLGMNNVPVRIAQAQLRHRDPALTFNVHTHVIEEARRQAVEQVENDLFSIVLSEEDSTLKASPVEATK
jgi:integrase